MLEQVAPVLAYQNLFADKAYAYLSRQSSLPFTAYTPARKAPGQTHLDAADRPFSAAASRIRHPIEALFHWVQEKTWIEVAGKVHSYRGLLVHVFGRLTASCSR
ncbi:transposase IS4 family protein [Methylocaldum marinum]|uniref:Transposase IS4 family protein n=1 Tax=Methylocaldum marinum TaxID=1432792 RepID=A0A250L0A7_9GAMM|nr:transposase IS4 family protein [Methylocaldum marinum]